MCPRRGAPSVHSRRHREELGCRRSSWCDAVRGKRKGTSGRHVSRAASDLERFEEVARWLRSYEVEEIDGAIGSICLYEAVDPRSDPAAFGRGRPPC